MQSQPETASPPDSLFLEQKQRALLRADVLKAVFSFPKLFNRPLYGSYEKLVVNCPTHFLKMRSPLHLRKILCVQFFLQKKIEEALQNEQGKLLFLKLFRGPSCIGLALAHSHSFAFQKSQVLKTLEILLPGICEVPKSSYQWHSADLPYTYLYFEMDKLRGKELSNGYLAGIERTLKEQLQATSPLTPAIFWPFNKEESHRQIQLLIREMTHKEDLPHISIHFQEQTASSLEFLVHLVRPHSDVPIAFDRLPESLYFFRYAHHVIHTPFSIEIDAFSIKIPAQIFNVRDSINLLYARRYLIKQLEMLIGPFRDYNGGLFEKQQDHFEKVRLQLASKIPYFDLFAEKVFYALHPFERWLFLSIEEVQQLFQVFSDLIRDPRSNTARSTALFTVIKSENRTDSLRGRYQQMDLNAYAQLTIGNDHYECFSGHCTPQWTPKIIEESHTLRLAFQEGAPPSLNPHYSSSDMRSRLLSKMLFEGLTRLNPQGEPILTGASSYQKSIDGLTYIFRIRESFWSNGEKVTAVDYADSWRGSLEDFVSHPEVLFCIKNAKKYREKGCPLNQVGIEVIDPTTLRVELEKPDPEFLHKLSQPFFFPLFGKNAEPKWFNGPYLVQESKTKGFKFERNPYYRKSEKESFARVEIQILENVEEIFSLFQAGKIDWIGDPLSILSLQHIRALEKTNTLRKADVFRRFSLFFNTKHPILSSRAIRQALHLSIDRAHICKEIFPHSIPLPTSTPSLAKAFLEEGLRELKLSRLPPLTFSYSNQTRRDLLAQYLKETWEKHLGLEIHVQQHPWNQFRSYLEKKQFEICGTIHDTLNEDSVEFLERFEGENSYNFSGWTHLVFQELLSAAKKTASNSEKRALLAQAKAILTDHVPFSPLFNYTHLYAIHPRLECSSVDPEGCIDFSQGKRK